MRLEHKYRAGLEHLGAGRLGSAEACLRAVAAENPSFAPAHYNLGLVFQGRGKLTAAAHAFRTAVAVEAGLAQAQMALAATLQRLGDGEGAERHARQAVQAAAMPASWLLLGDVLRGLGRLDDAGAAYAAAARLSPDDLDVRFRRGFLALLQGDYAAGWVGYAFRPARRDSDPALRPEWRGEDLTGRTLLLHGEQGMGDNIQFLRYVPELAARGAKVLVALPPALAGLAARVEGVAEVVRPSLTLPGFDACCPLPSLGLLCGTRLDTIPRPAGYLSPPEDRLARWRTRLGEDARFTVALAWAGNPEHLNDHNRSIALAELASLLRTPGVRWLSLQKGAAGAELRRLRGPEIADLGADLADFSDTAAVMACADLVISVDTAACHLAGALGRPVWTLLPFAPDWRWLSQGLASPWYDSMRLYRQSRAGSWAEPIAEAARDLAALAARGA